MTTCHNRAYAYGTNQGSIHGDELFIAGGMSAQGRTLGDLYRIDLTTGESTAFGNVVPVGAAADLSFDEHGEGLLYAGGYAGNNKYRDLWRVTINGRVATSALIHDFAWDGMRGSDGFVVVSDIFHKQYWALPGYQLGQNAGGVYFLWDARLPTPRRNNGHNGHENRHGDDDDDHDDDNDDNDDRDGRCGGARGISLNRGAPGRIERPDDEPRVRRLGPMVQQVPRR